ncbi:hypothetical protein BACI349Y_620040 [Bacillus sp. 349Y]|nr:hypothetical protein BACI349Y_620040 [Bacillus sp. 349Y]
MTVRRSFINGLLLGSIKRVLSWIDELGLSPNNALLSKAHSETSFGSQE